MLGANKMKIKKSSKSSDLSVSGDPYVTESTAACGRGRETEEGKVTSRQEGIYAVAVCADNFSVRIERSSFLVKLFLQIKKSSKSSDLSVSGDPYVTESTAACGRGRETEEGKVTSRQEGIYAVAVCADNFSVRIERSSFLVKLILQIKKAASHPTYCFLVTRTRIELVIPP